MQQTHNSDLTEAEAEQYDRQIRLWGQEAQKRMRDARVVIIGVSGIGAEVAKNVVLAGMNVSIYDNKLVQESDLAAQLFVSAEDIGQNRATASQSRIQELNPLVTVTAHAIASTQSLAHGESITDTDLSSAACVVICDMPDPQEALLLAERCHNSPLHVPVIVANSFGFWSFFFVDFGKEHHFTVTKTTAAKSGSSSGGSGGEDTVVDVPRTLKYVSFQDAVMTPWSDAALSPKFIAPEVFLWIAMHQVGAAATMGANASSATISSSSSSSFFSSSSPLEQVAASVHEQAQRHCAASGIPISTESSSSTSTTTTTTTSSSSTTNTSTSRGKQQQQQPISASSFVKDIHTCTSFFQTKGIELSPVAAITGGMIGIEIAKLLTAKDEPIYNVFAFDGMGGSGGNVAKFAGRV